MFEYPIRLFFLSLVGLWLAAQIGASLQKWRTLNEEQRSAFTGRKPGRRICLALCTSSIKKIDSTKEKI